jgi:NAD+ synthase
MKLDSGVFKIDAAAYVDRLCDFIRESQSALHRDGILVPFSGGLDSSTILLLCRRAVGSDHILALLMPEKQGNPEAERYARIVTGQYQIKTITRDISPILSSLGTYQFILSAVPFRSVQNWATQTYMKSTGSNPFLQIMQGKASDLERRGYAKYMTKQRIRAVMEYLVAEELNFLVAGSAHKSEDMVGLFVKFGVDDIADIMPLKNLYRSHILQLAEYLGVPAEILNRTPNPDIIPGVSDKYVDMLGLPYDKVDLVLYGIEHGMEDDLIAGQLNLPEKKVAEIRSLILDTEHMRTPSRCLTWE